MTEGPINLNKARKARAKADARRRADENAVKFGRTGAQKKLDAKRAEKASNHLNEHKIEDKGETFP